MKRTIWPERSPLPQRQARRRSCSRGYAKNWGQSALALALILPLLLCALPPVVHAAPSLEEQAAAAFERGDLVTSGRLRLESAEQEQDLWQRYARLRDATNDLLSPAATGVTEQDLGRLRQALLDLRMDALRDHPDGEEELVAAVDDNLERTNRALAERSSDPDRQNPSPSREDRTGSKAGTAMLASGGALVAVGAVLIVVSIVGMARGVRFQNEIPTAQRTEADIEEDGRAANRLAAGAGISGLLLGGGGAALIVLGTRARKRSVEVALGTGLQIRF